VHFSVKIERNSIDFYTNISYTSNTTTKPIRHDTEIQGVLPCIEK
jgi:hypothetical protein